MILITLLAGQSSLAGCPEDCKSALTAADKVISDQAKQIDLYSSALHEQEDQIARLSVSINDKNQALEAWYRNPFVIGTIGIVLGGAGVLYLTK